MTTKAQQIEKILVRMDQNPDHQVIYRDLDRDLLVVKFTDVYGFSERRTISYAASTTWGNGLMSIMDVGTPDERLSWSSGTSNDDATSADIAAVMKAIFTDAAKHV